MPQLFGRCFTFHSMGAVGAVGSVCGVKCMAIATRIMFVNLCTDCCCSLAATTGINKKLLDHIFKHALNPEGHYLGSGFGKIGARRWQPCSAIRRPASNACYPKR